jgi:tripartite-type tricarboxylate transporter receptor subunit TctC
LTWGGSSTNIVDKNHNATGRSMIATVLAALALVCAALNPAAAADYPERPITLIIPFPPGGSTGFTAKVLADALEAGLKQPVKVEPKTGNFGINAISEIVGKADGYTVMVGSIITNSMTPVMHRDKISFDYDREIVPITKLAAFPSVLMTQPGNPAGSVKDALAALKSGSGQLRFGTDFPGTYVDVDFVMLGKAAGLKVSIRSANGALAILSDLTDGKIDMAMLNVATASANIGKYKPLAVTSATRLSNFPDVPTMAEAGFPQIGTSNWQGLFAARATPPEIIRTLHRAAVDAMNTAKAREEIGKVNAAVVTSESPDKLAAEIAAEMAQWRAVAPEVMALPKEN